LHGEFTVAKIDKKEVSGQEYILEELRSIRETLAKTERRAPAPETSIEKRQNFRSFCMKDELESDINRLIKEATKIDGVEKIVLEERSPKHRHIVVHFTSYPTQTQRLQAQQILGGRGVTKNRSQLKFKPRPDSNLD
jgi:hypothetical protein